MVTPARHQCLIYSGSPAKHLRALAAQTLQRLNENYRCVHLNSPKMIATLELHLRIIGVDVAQETARGSLVLSSGQDHLMNGCFNVDGMIGTLETTIDRALSDGYRGLWATGDMSWEFGPNRDFAKLAEYEWRLEELFKARTALSGICQYHSDTLPREAMRDGLGSHTSLFINETLSMVNPYYVRRPVQGLGAMGHGAIDAAIEDLCRLGN
jgi:hypothetical protein